MGKRISRSELVLNKGDACSQWNRTLKKFLNELVNGQWKADIAIFSQLISMFRQLGLIFIDLCPLLEMIVKCFGFCSLMQYCRFSEMTFKVSV